MIRLPLEPTASLPAIVERIGWLLVHSLWQFALLALLATAVCLLMHRRSAAARYRMLVAAIALVVIAPVATWFCLPPAASSLWLAGAERSEAVGPASPDIGWSHGESWPRSPAPQATMPVDSVSKAPTSPDDESAVMTVPLEGLNNSWIQRTITLVGPWLSTIVVGWSLGVLVFSLRPVLGWYTVRQLRRVGVSAVNETVWHRLASLKQTLALARRVEVLQSTLVNAPIVVGCFRSVILLPASLLTGLPASQLDAILTHELAHVRRYDYLVNLAQTLIETLFFYHPAVWWLSHRIRVERENCCDDLVVATLGNKVDYGRALLAIEEYRGGAASLALGASDGSLTARVRRLFQVETGPSPRASAGMVALSVAVACFLLLTIWSAVSADDNPPADAGQTRKTEKPFRLADHWIIEDIRWVNDDKQLLTASIQGGINIRRWNVADRQLLSHIKLASDQHGRPVIQGTIQFSADGSRVIGVTDEYVGVWDAATGELLRQLSIPQKEWEFDTVRTLGCSASGSVIVGGLGTSYDRTTQVYPSYGIAWDAESGAVLCTFEQQAGFYLVDVAVAADGLKFATLSEGHRVCVWETFTGNLLSDFSSFAHEWTSPNPALIKNNVIRGIELAPDGRRLAIVGSYGIRLIDVASGNLLRTIDAPTRFGSADLDFSSDGQYLARFGSRRGREDAESVVIWSLKTGEPVGEVVTSGNIARFSHDGRWLAIGDADFFEAVSIWPLTGEKSLGPLPPPEKVERIDRVEENTHRRGASAAELAGRWQVSWGRPEGGLQYGIALTSAGDQFRIGQRVTMVAFLKNTSEQSLHIDLRPDMFGNLPRIVAADGEFVELSKRDLLGRVAHYRDTLQPGDMFGPLYFNVGLGENPHPNRQVWTPYWQLPEAGRFQVTHRISVGIADPAGADPDELAWQPAQLTSGSIEFAVVADR